MVYLCLEYTLSFVLIIQRVLASAAHILKLIIQRLFRWSQIVLVSIFVFSKYNHFLSCFTFTVESKITCVHGIRINFFLQGLF